MDQRYSVSSECYYTIIICITCIFKICFFFTTLGLHCCVQSFSSCSKHWRLIAVTSCGTWALGMWASVAVVQAQWLWLAGSRALAQLWHRGLFAPQHVGCSWCVCVHAQSCSDPLGHYGLQPTRLLCPWIFQAGILGQIAIPFSRVASQSRY